MNFLKLLPVILSAVLLAAHYLRSGFLLVAAFCLLCPALLLIKRRWVVRLFQVFLLLAAGEWILTMFSLIAERQLMGEPWTRMAIILGVVAAFTAGSGLVFRAKSLRARYNFETVQQTAEEAAAQ